MHLERDGILVFHGTLVEVFVVNKKTDKSNDDEKLRDLYNEVSLLGAVKRNILVSKVTSGRWVMGYMKEWYPSYVSRLSLKMGTYQTPCYCWI